MGVGMEQLRLLPWRRPARGYLGLLLCFIERPSLLCYTEQEKSALEAGLLRKLFRPHAVLVGQEVTLRFAERTTRDRSYGIPESITYDICLTGSRQRVGYISLRLGESPEIYYLGHIGYRVEPAFRGHGLAARAVTALRPLIIDQGINSLSITTDTDNIPSRKTCERLQCVLESIVPVPMQYRALCMNSPAKCRYIYFPQGDNPGKDSVE